MLNLTNVNGINSNTFIKNVQFGTISNPVSITNNNIVGGSVVNRILFKASPTDTTQHVWSKGFYTKNPLDNKYIEDLKIDVLSGSNPGSSYMSDHRNYQMSLGGYAYIHSTGTTLGYVNNIDFPSFSSLPSDSNIELSKKYNSVCYDDQVVLEIKPSKGYKAALSTANGFYVGEESQQISHTFDISNNATEWNSRSDKEYFNLNDFIKFYTIYVPNPEPYGTWYFTSTGTSNANWSYYTSNDRYYPINEPRISDFGKSDYSDGVCTIKYTLVYNNTNSMSGASLTPSDIDNIADSNKVPVYSRTYDLNKPLRNGVLNLKLSASTINSLYNRTNGGTSLSSLHMYIWIEYGGSRSSVVKVPLYGRSESSPYYINDEISPTSESIYRLQFSKNNGSTSSGITSQGSSLKPSSTSGSKQFTICRGSSYSFTPTVDYGLTSKIRVVGVENFHDATFNSTMNFYGFDDGTTYTNGPRTFVDGTIDNGQSIYFDTRHNWPSQTFSIVIIFLVQGVEYQYTYLFNVEDPVLEYVNIHYCSSASYNSSGVLTTTYSDRRIPYNNSGTNQQLVTIRPQFIDHAAVVTCTYNLSGLSNNDLTDVFWATGSGSVAYYDIIGENTQIDVNMGYYDGSYTYHCYLAGYKSSSYGYSNKHISFNLSGWSGGCVSDDSKILTNTGYKLAREICVGDELAYYDDNFNILYSPVLNVYTAGNIHFITQILLEDNTFIKVTDNHPILTNNGYANIYGDNNYKQLKVGDFVLTLNGYKKVLDIQQMKYNEKSVYNFYTDSDSFIVNNVVTACENPDLVSILHYTLNSFNRIEGTKVNCITGDTRVLAENENKYLLAKDVKVGDKILILNNDNDLIQADVSCVVTTNKVDKIFHIVIDGDNELSVSPNHPILTDNGYKNLDGSNNFDILSMNDSVYTLNGFKKIKDIVETENTDILYNFAINNDSFVANNVVVASADLDLALDIGNINKK